MRLLVEEGDRVKQGDLLAEHHKEFLSGSEGNTLEYTENSLHFSRERSHWTRRPPWVFLIFLSPPAAVPPLFEALITLLFHLNSRLRSLDLQPSVSSHNQV
ncbi:hypothetical protein [Shewanella sp. YLB-07]|uniref:hypothetical protein n=1 Tax=Shewanella sp. YLB-07 TaxID=2601268 RepID=UPI0022406038|nr:hypothetical protein [Shewanella sp. YLB-07]